MVELPRWTLKEQIGQMVVVRASGYLFDHQRLYPTREASAAKLNHWLQNLNLGGVILLGGSAAELAVRSQQLQNWAKTPLLLAADIEEGVGQRFSGATWFPPPMSLAHIAADNLNLATDLAYQMGAITASEALAIGINWVLAPVVDVNNNPDNPVINVRAFGNTPEIVSNLATAFIEGAKQYPVLTTAKHFPGHGDTAVDSHLHLPTIPHSPARLETMELIPFKKAIAAQVDSVMSAHLLIPAWDNIHPATLSQPILTGKLRSLLEFKGLIVTDALIMGGVSNFASPGEVAVMAVEAGADILLMPENPEVAIEAVYQAVLSGRLTSQRITESVTRIWQAKEKVNLITPPISPNLHPNQTPESRGKPTPNPSQDGKEHTAQFVLKGGNIDSSFVDQLSLPQSVTIVETILRKSVVTGGVLPVEPSGGKHLLLVDDVLSCDFLGKHTPGVKFSQKLDYQVQIVDQNTFAFDLDDSQKTLLSIFIRGNPFRGSAGLSVKTQEKLKQLLTTGLVTGLLVYGSPYVLDWLRPNLPPHLPWVFSYGQMPQSQAVTWDIMFCLSRFPDFQPENFL